MAEAPPTGKRCVPPDYIYAVLDHAMIFKSKECERSGEVDFGFDFDDEESVGFEFSGRAKFALRVFERSGEGSEDDLPIHPANKVKAAFLLDEFCVDGAAHICVI